MERKIRVILSGESLVLAGLQAILEQELSIAVIAHKLPCSGSRLHELHPDVIIYDTTALQPGFRAIMAQELPGLLLIGIDPNSHQVTVWSGRQLHELSGSDLIEIITTGSSSHGLKR